MYKSHKRYVCVYGCIGHGDDESGEDWNFAFVLLKKYIFLNFFFFEKDKWWREGGGMEWNAKILREGF